MLAATACHTASSSPSAFGGGHTALAVMGASAARIIKTFIFIVIGVFMSAEATQMKPPLPLGTPGLRTASAVPLPCAEFFSCHQRGAKLCRLDEVGFPVEELQNDRPSCI